MILSARRGAATAFGQVLGAVGGAQVLGVAPGDVDSLVRLVGIDRYFRARELFVGAVLRPARKMV